MKKLSLAIIGTVLTGSLVFFQNCSSGSLPSSVTSSSTAASSSSASAAAADCSVDGVASVASGTSQINLYSQATATNNVCPSPVTMTCNNGVWSATVSSVSTGVVTGSDSTSVVQYSAAYSSCAGVVAAASCAYNGNTLSSGSSTLAYSASSVAYGSSCTSVQETLTCNNGSLVNASGGSVSTYYTSCSVAAQTGTWENYSTASILNYTYSNPQCPGSVYSSCTNIGEICYVPHTGEGVAIAILQCQ